MSGQRRWPLAEDAILRHLRSCKQLEIPSLCLEWSANQPPANNLITPFFFKKKKNVLDSNRTRRRINIPAEIPEEVDMAEGAPEAETEASQYHPPSTAAHESRFGSTEAAAAGSSSPNTTTGANTANNTNGTS